MDELREQFAKLDEIAAPDVWGEGSTRTPRATDPHGLDPRPRQRVTAAVVAFVVFIAAGVFAVHVYEQNARIGPASPTVAADPLASIKVGWTRLPSPPIVLPDAVYVWAGRELLVWGGSASKGPASQGYAFDAATQSWSSIPPAPIPGGYVRAVWTGTEAVFLGVGSGAASGQGEAFDPVTNTWRVIAEGPFTSRPAVVVWTGSEIIAWGSGARDTPADMSGAAYDPVHDSWHTIADAPIGLNTASGAWTGGRMIVFGSLLDGGNHSAARFAAGETYDPLSDSWQPIAPSDLSPQASAAVWNGDRLIAYDYDWKAAEYNVATDSWHPIEDLPLRAGECYPDGAAVAGTVFAFGCGDAATLAPGERTWTPVRGGLTTATIDAHGQPYKLWRFASLIPAGDVLFLAAEGLTIMDGAPCYGCSGSPTSLWVYRPA